MAINYSPTFTKFASQKHSLCVFGIEEFTDSENNLGNFVLTKKRFLVFLSFWIIEFPYLQSKAL